MIRYRRSIDGRTILLPMVRVDPNSGKKMLLPDGLTGAVLPVEGEPSNHLFQGVLSHKRVIYQTFNSSWWSLLTPVSIIQVPHTKKQRKRRFLKIIDLGHTVVLFRGSEGGFVFVNNANMYTCRTDIDKHLRKLPCRLWSYLPMSEWLLTIFMSISRDGKRHHKCCSNGPFCMYNEENVYFSP